MHVATREIKVYLKSAAWKSFNTKLEKIYLYHSDESIPSAMFSNFAHLFLYGDGTIFSNGLYFTNEFDVWNILTDKQ